jgi:hypothetical protein
MKKILLLLITITFAFSNVGKITALKGEVYIIRDSKQISANTGSILILKDQIKTQKKARALVLFNDNTSITVGQNSSLSVDEFVMDLKNPENSKTNFGFGKGIFRTITGKIGKVNPKGFKIKTKSASIGIRGTTLDTAVKILPSGEEEVSVAFIKGHGIITSNINGIDIPVDTGENANMLQNGQNIVSKGPLKETKQMNKEAKELESEAQNNTTASSNINLEEVLTEIDALTNNENEDKTQKSIISSNNALDKLIESTTKDTICPSSSLCTSYTSYNITDFGYLKNDSGTIVDSYIQGTETSPSVINNYIHTNQTGTYNGTIYGEQSGTNIGTSTTEGTIQLNMDFGDKSFNGNMVIYNGNWQVSIADGSITAKGFSSDTLSGTAGSDAITSGNINGQYYGSDAAAAAGTFKVSTDTQQVIGVFGSTK